MLLDPLEEQFHLPAIPVEIGDGQGGQGEVVGQENEGMVALCIEVSDPVNLFRVFFLHDGSREGNDLIALNAGGLVDGPGIEALSAEVGFRPGHEEGRCLLDPVKPAEIQIGPIHNVNSPRLEDQIVEDVDVVNLPRRHDDDGRDVAPEIQKGVQFDGALVFPELGPGKQGQAEIDGGRIQDVDRLIQFDAERIGCIEGSCLGDQEGSEIGKNPRIPDLIGVSQGVAGHLSPDAQVIKPGLGCP